MAKTPTKLLLILSTFLLITTFYLSNFFHQKHFNITFHSKLLPTPSNHNNPSINKINNHSHHHHYSLHNLSVSTKISYEPQKKSNSKSSVEKIEDGLARARASIRKAAQTRSIKPGDNEGSFIPRGAVYRNPYAFQQSHKEMVKRFKIWTYKEGERPLVHQGPMSLFYGVEGHFIQEMEEGMSTIGTFLASHPNEAHVFFLPISAVNIRISFYQPQVFDHKALNKVVLDYIHMLVHKHPYWNRSHGADHFMLSCHDWAPDITKKNPNQFKNFIRALCNANTSEGFEPIRDVSIPEVNIPSSHFLNQPIKGLRLSERHILAFFAGGNHGHVRNFLFKHWNNDTEIQVHNKLPKHQKYYKMLGKSKYCLCPSGYEVASSRIVEALIAECVPVIVKDDYSFPFSDVLDWSRFSVYVPVYDIPKIKVVLKGISGKKYLELVKGVRSVRWHFTFNRPSKPFDLIHMVLHSVWLRRLNIKLP